jgi:hypothetical protein
LTFVVVEGGFPCGRLSLREPFLVGGLSLREALVVKAWSGADGEALAVLLDPPRANVR